MLSSVDDVVARLSEQRYIADRPLATVVYLALRLRKPILVEGPAGVGKTELARAAAAALGRRLIRLQCYEGLDEAKALYEWEYGKQLLYSHLLRGKVDEVVDPARDLGEAAAALRAHDDVFFNPDFLVERPILAAIRSDEPTVLLVDEIDRADEEFEAFLLEFLSDHAVSVPELGTLTATSVPLTVLTSNRTRELSEALRRRCLHLNVGYPDHDRELRIVRLRVPDLAPPLAEQLVAFVQSLRDLDLRKAPSIGETLDWASALVVLGATELSPELIRETVAVLAKHDTDAERVLASIADDAETDVERAGQAAVPSAEPATYLDAKRRPRLRPGERA